MKTFDEIVPQFLANVKIRVKDRAYASYKGKLRVFSEWLANNELSAVTIDLITEQHIEQFSIYLANERKLDRPTCKKYFTVLRQIFQYGITRGYATKIPTDLFVFPQKKGDFGAQVIEKEDMKTLLTEIEKKDKQLYLACLMQYYCFTRPGKELRLLRVKDIDTNNWTIKVDASNAKNGHKRVVTIPNHLIEVLKEYGIERADKNKYLFSGHKQLGDKPCSINAMRYRFNTHRNRLGLPQEYKFYSLKCSGATSLHNSNTVSIRSIMDQLGHLSLSATQHYLKRHSGAIDVKIKEGFPSPY